MNKALRNQLDLLSEVAFRELELALQMAKSAKQLIKEFRLTPEDFCARMDINPDQIKTYLSGSYPYDIRNMASMQALYVELHTKKEAEEAAKRAELNFVDVNTPKQ